MIRFLLYTVLCLIVLPVFALTLLWLYIRHHFSYWERRRIPHIKPSLLTGNMKEWLRTKHSGEIFAKVYEMYKHRQLLFAGFYFNMQIAVMALDLSFVRQVLVDNFHAFQNRGLFHNEISDPLTGNLFLLDGGKWKRLRSTLTPTFFVEKMQHIFPTMLIVGEGLQEAFKDNINESGNGVFEITYILNRFSCDVIGNCVFGLDCRSLKDPSIEFFMMARKFFSARTHSALVENLINLFPEWAKFLRVKIIPQDVSDFYIKLVTEIMGSRERPRRRIYKRSYLGLLMELKSMSGKNGVPLTVEEQAAQAFSFFITAFDTCASALGSALYELARNQNIQNKLRKEIIRTLDERGKELTYECLHEMKYLDQVTSGRLLMYMP